MVYIVRGMFYKIKEIFVRFGVSSSLIFIAISSVYAEKVAVIANPATPALSEKDIKDIFLGFKTELPDGTPARPISLKGDGVKEKFFKVFIGTTLSEFKTHWLTKALAGEGVPPPELSIDEVIERVKTQKGAIGFIPADKVPSDVKVLFEIK